MLMKFRELFSRLHLNTFGIGIDANPGDPGEVRLDFFQNVQQALLWNNECIAVA